MQTDIKEVGPCKMQIKIEIPAEDIKEKLESKYKDFAAAATVPGFRKGLAPRDLVERKFGKEIKDEFKNDTIIAAIADVVKEKKLQPIGDPQLDFNKVALDVSKPLAFEFTLEVAPTVDVTDYVGIKATRTPVEVTAKEIDGALEIVRQRHGEWHVTENKAAQKENMIVFNQETWIENKRIHQSENSNYIIGSELRFLGKVSNELGDQMIGVKSGETKEITLKVPENAEKAEYRGKEAKLKMTIKEVKEIKFPEINEEWAKSIGFDSVPHMREELKKRLIKQKEEEVNYKIEEQILDDILKRTTFPVPESLVNDNINYLLRRWATDMVMQKKPEKEIMAEVETLKPKAKELSEKQLRMEFICDNIAKKEKIFVTEDEVNQRINELAGRYQKWPNEIKKYYEDNNLMGQLRAELREEKVRKFLREKAQIAEETIIAPPAPTHRGTGGAEVKETTAKETGKTKHHKEEKKG